MVDGNLQYSSNIEYISVYPRYQVDEMAPAPDSVHGILESIRRRESLTELELTSLLKKKVRDSASVDYDSLSHVMEEDKLPQGITNCEAMALFLQGNIGIGVLMLPCAVKYAGLIGGILGLLFLSLICTYCMGMLVKSSHKALESRKDTPCLDYGDTAEAAFSDAGGFWGRYSSAAKKLLNLFLCANQIGTCAVYALFIVNRMKRIFSHYGGPALAALNYRYYILMVIPFILMICFIRNLKYLSPFSLLANVIQFIDLGVIFYYYFRDEF